MRISPWIQNLRQSLTSRAVVVQRRRKNRRTPQSIEGLESRTLLTGPAVVSINLVEAPTNNATTLSWTATFDQAVTGVDPTDFSLAKTGTVGTTLMQVTGSGSSYTVTVSGISGNGTIGLNLADNDSIQDVSSMPLGGAGTGNGDFTGQIYTLDHVDPGVVSIDRTTPTDATTDVTSVTFTATFNESVTGVDASDFALIKTESIAETSVQVTPLSSKVYSITVSGITGTGTLGLKLVDNASIRDLAGNPLANLSVAPTFARTVTYQPRGLYDPSDMVVTDMNGDGQPDILVANTFGHSIDVFLGNGDGTFQTQRVAIAQAYPTALAVGDVNGDGKPDLEIINASDSTVKVALGNGDGTFQTAQAFAVGAGPFSVVMRDLNGDGKLDLTVPHGNNQISVLLGNGDGTFQSQRAISSPNGSTSVAVADVNGDGKPDLVLGGSAVSVMLGNGDGSFQSAQTFTVDQHPYGVVVGDLNGDGKPDLVVGNVNTGSNSGTISVLLGNGDGTFQVLPSFASGQSPFGLLALGDMNGDGILDIVSADGSNRAAGIYLGNGDGTFRTEQTLPYSAEYDPTVISVQDLNADGRPDITLVDDGAESIWVSVATSNDNFVGQVYTITTPLNPPVPNHAPKGTATTVLIAQGAPYVLQTSDFGFSDPNDTPSNSLLAVSFTLLSAYGTLTDDGVPVTANQFISAADISAGKLVFTPSVSVTGTTLFLAKFQVQDNGGIANGGQDLDPVAKIMYFRLGIGNHAPVGTTTTISTPYDGPYTLKTSDFGFTDPNDTPANSLLAVKFTLLSAYGTLTDNGVAVTVNQFVSATDISQGKLVFTPSVSALGSTLFLAKFQVQDNGGTVYNGHDLDPVAKVLYAHMVVANHAPVGTTATVATGLKSSYTLKTSDFGFTDPSDNPANSLLAVKFTLLSSYGTLTNNGLTVAADQFVSAVDISSGKLVFTPNQSASGKKIFLAKCQVQDNGGTANGGQDLDPVAKILYFGVSPNHAPVGLNGFVTTPKKTPYTLHTSDFGFSDPNDHPPNSLAAVQITLLGAYGTLTEDGVAVTANQFISVTDINAGKLVFTPTAGITGNVLFVCLFKVQDDGGHQIGYDLDPNTAGLYATITP